MVFFAGDLAVQTKGVHKVRVECKRRGGGGGLMKKFLGEDVLLNPGTLETLNQTYM